MVTGDKPIRNKEKFNGSRPICFVYSGVGTQWKTMGRDLLKMEVFKKTFDRCANALKTYDIDLYYLLCSSEKTIFDNIANCYIAITAIQIALTDVLISMGIKPDYFIGHSLGEQGKLLFSKIFKYISDNSFT